MGADFWVGRLHELLDLDGAHGAQRDGLEVGLVDDHVLALAPLVAPDRVGTRDLAVLRAVRLHLDAPEAGDDLAALLRLLVQQVEGQAAARLGGQVQADRDGDQPELDGAAPHRSSHETSGAGRVLDGASGTRRRRAYPRTASRPRAGGLRAAGRYPRPSASISAARSVSSATLFAAALLLVGCTGASTGGPGGIARRHCPPGSSARWHRPPGPGALRYVALGRLVHVR